ncbi:MAG: AbrB/MazE/SpoVT family DNA-binding domain-containing protein [Rhizobiaceae bacterium]|nr:AbrB/MazE/SpoVT family DNA-binding domain-containing protein [Rhizobiaceae bacterium]
MDVKLRRVGNSMGIIIPKELLERYALQEGDDLELRAEEHRIVLHISDVAFQRQIQAARNMMEKYRVALKKLAE